MEDIIARALLELQMVHGILEGTKPGEPAQMYELYDGRSRLRGVELEECLHRLELGEGRRLFYFELPYGGMHERIAENELIARCERIWATNNFGADRARELLRHGSIRTLLPRVGR
jgi:hypothetical protein